VPVLHNLRVTLEMIKWEHSVFMLPFALCGAMLAANGLPSAHVLAWIIVAMVTARSAAMAFNRLAMLRLTRPTRELKHARFLLARSLPVS